MTAQRYELAVDATLLPPDAAADSVVRKDEVTIRDVYHDTADLDLLDVGITLQRRDFGDRSEWTLRATDAGEQIVAPRATGESDSAPDELTYSVGAIAAARSLRPIAAVRIMRRQFTVLVDDAIVGEIRDDTVHGTRLGEAQIASAWRTVTVSGEPDGIRAADTLVRAAGGRSAQAACPLRRALLHTLAEDTSPADAPTLLGDYLAEQIGEILVGDVLLRCGEDAVHRTRVGIRRVRSTLRTMAPFLDRSAASTMDDELSWYAGILGRERDVEVQRDRLLAAVAELPDALKFGPVAARIEQFFAEQAAEFGADSAAARTEERYLALMTALVEWRREPPFAPVRKKGRKLLAKRTKRAGRKADSRLRSAIAAPSDDTLLHRARKAAKRARYAGELAEPMIGAKAAKVRKRNKKVQRVLGEHQDSVVARGLLRTLASGAGTTGDNGFTYGLLYAREEDRARHAREKIARRT